MNPARLRAEDERGLARPGPVGELSDRLREVGRVRDQRHEVLEDDALRSGSPGRRGSGRGDRASSCGPLHCPAQLADDQEMRELLGDARERLEVVERVLATLRVARPQARRDELLDERRLPPGRRSGTSAGVARRSRSARGERTRPRCLPRVSPYSRSPPSVRERTRPYSSSWRTRSGDTEARSQSSASSISSSWPSEPDAAPPRSVTRGTGAVELLANHAQRQELVALQLEDRRQPLDVGRREQPVAASRPARRDQALILEVADLRDGDVRELLSQLLADGADRTEPWLRPTPLAPCRDRAHRWRNVSRYLPICTSSSSSRTADSMRRRLT